MKPSICKISDLGISIPEACDLSHWLIPVGKVAEIENPDRNHAYITPDHKVYVLNQEGTGLAVLEENIIEHITKNGTGIAVNNKIVNIEVPTKTSELINDNDFIADPHYVRTDNNYSDADKGKLASIAANAEVNLIEEVKVNGASLPIFEKSVDIELTSYEEKANKVNEINQTANPTQYASAKAVYDYVQSTINELDGTKIAIGIAERNSGDTFNLDIPVLGSTRNELNGSLIIVYFENTTGGGCSGEFAEMTINGVTFATRKEFLNIPGTASGEGSRPLMCDVLERRAMVFLDHITFTGDVVSRARVFMMDNADGDSIIKNDKGLWEVSTKWLESNYDTGTPDVMASDVKTQNGSNVQDELNTINSNEWVNSARLGNSSVIASKIGTSAVTEAKIGTSAVTEAKIADRSVTAAKQYIIYRTTEQLTGRYWIDGKPIYQRTYLIPSKAVTSTFTQITVDSGLNWDFFSVDYNYSTYTETTNGNRWPMFMAENNHMHYHNRAYMNGNNLRLDLSARAVSNAYLTVLYTKR